MLILKNDNSVKIEKIKNKLLFNGVLGILDLIIISHVKIIIKDNLFIIKSNKKNYLNLYFSLIKQKIKGVSVGYRIPLYVKGIGYKITVNENNRTLKLKLGYSYLIEIFVPDNIKIVLNKKNLIIFSSIDLNILTSFIFYLKKLRKNNVYKYKGLFLITEIGRVLKEIKKK